MKELPLWGNFLSAKRLEAFRHLHLSVVIILLIVAEKPLRGGDNKVWMDGWMDGWMDR